MQRSVYEMGLVALAHLYDACGHAEWRDRMNEDYQKWRRTGSTIEHRERYQGRSKAPFLGLIFSRDNGSTITDRQEDWSNSLLVLLRHICESFARRPTALFHERSLRLTMGGTKGTRLEGRGCRACGYCDVATGQIDTYLSEFVLREEILRCFAINRPKTVVNRAMRMSLPGLEARRRSLVEGATAAGIAVRDEYGFCDWPDDSCPACQNPRHFFGYTWDVTPSGSVSASIYNFPLLKSARRRLKHPEVHPMIPPRIAPAFRKYP